MNLLHYIYHILIGIIPLIVSVDDVISHRPVRLDLEISEQKENVLIHTDRSIYIAGETIWLSAYVFKTTSGHISDYSKVVYLDLIGTAGEAITRIKIGVKEGRGKGSISLPEEIASGNYLLRAYTQDMRNYGEESFYRQHVTILHPHQKLLRHDSKQARNQSSNKIKERDLKDLNFQIKSNASQISQRDMVKLEISVLDGSNKIPADISIAVVPRNSVTTGDRTIINNSNTPIPSSRLYPSEEYGMIISGKVLGESDQESVPAVLVYLSIPKEAPLLYTSISDKEGNFQFRLPKIYGPMPVVLQSNPEEKRKIRFEIKDEFHSAAMPPPPFRLDEAIIPVVENILKNVSISKSYESFKAPIDYYSSFQFPQFPFFGQPDVRYVLDDYTRFPLVDFFIEVVPEVRVNGKKDEVRLRVLNSYESGVGIEEALLAVDGVPIFDVPTFLRINNKLVKSTEVFTTPFWLNPQVFDGIIHLSTFEGDAQCFDLPNSAIRRSYLGLFPNRDFREVSAKSSGESHLPQFRNTLYWNPQILTDDQGECSIEFPSSDALGAYDVYIYAVSHEGKVGSVVAKSFEVVKKVK
jgi:hypothetical protein